MSQTPPRETIPKYYLINIQNFLDQFPFNQWTPEYIEAILEIIKIGIENYGIEEFLKELNPSLYSTYVENRKKLSEVLFILKSIQGYHRHFLWSPFVESYGMNPQDYFIGAFNEFRNFPQTY